MQNKQFGQINVALFGQDSIQTTQLDWISQKSRNRILLIDAAQSIKPADLPREMIEQVVARARVAGTYFHLASQMRVTGGNDYIEFAQQLLSDSPIPSPGFGEYDLRFYNGFGDMLSVIRARNAESGLARLVAGFAWDWRSKDDKNQHDIEIEGEKLFWNRTATDWVSSKTSAEEVGSIHTVQGYDLNYAGVIIGSDLGYDKQAGRIFFNRDNYFDVKGRENNKRLGIEYSDEDIRQYVLNIYRVLLTRGIKGTYIYVHDPALRAHLKQFFN